MKFDPSCRSGKLRCGMQHPLRASPHETFSRVINKVPVKTLIALAVSVLGVTIEPIASRMKEGWLVDNAPT